jgi:hypothetical protein
MEWTLSKIMTLILGVLVIIAVIVFIFKPSLLEVIKNLPEYNYQYDKEINMSKLTDAEKAGLCSGDLFIGGINRNLERQGGKEQFIDLYVNNNKLETTLYWDGDSDNAEIKLHVPGFLKSDIVIGEVKARQVRIYDNYLSLTTEYVNAENIAKGSFPSLEVLENLDGAYYVYGNFICRSKESKNQYCNRIWDIMGKKTFKLEFKGKCGISENGLVDFGKRGDCCIELSNTYLKTKDENLKWYWSGDVGANCKGIPKEYYRAYLVYYEDTNHWEVQLEGTLEGADIKILWGLGSSDCSKPTSLYSCVINEEISYMGSVTVGEGTCKK